MKSPKLMEFISLDPLNLYLVIELSIYIGYIDGLWLMLMTVNKLPQAYPLLVSKQS
jgi:hypothetical protein